MAFVIDIFTRYIVGWRVSRTVHVGFAQYKARMTERFACETQGCAELIWAVPPLGASQNAKAKALLRGPLSCGGVLSQLPGHEFVDARAWGHPLMSRV
nr:hypothetical protein [uncultured Acidocella sp.]